MVEAPGLSELRRDKAVDFETSGVGGKSSFKNIFGGDANSGGGQSLEVKPPNASGGGRS